MKPDLSTLTPPEIDKLWEKLYQEMFDIKLALQHQQKNLEEPPRWWTPKMKADCQLRIEGLRAEYATKQKEEKPFWTEWKKRKGWTRAYLVTNLNGHVHRDMHCSTCCWNTRFAWLTEFSGMDEEKIVETIGDKACTVCYPSAPVVKTGWEPSCNAERNERRAERKAKKEAKRLKDEAAGIRNPDGAPLEVRGTIHEIIKTERSAWIKLVDCIGWLNRAKQDNPWRAGYQEDAERCTWALAHKLGKSTEEITEIAKQKLARRR